jgi:sulfite oxidase
MAKVEPLKLLRKSFVTPKELFYVRGHGSVPEVDSDGYRLVVSGLVEQQLELSLDEIKTEFPKRELTATLYCAGNRRQELMDVSAMPGKLPWGAGAAGNARWAGVRLRDVVRAAGFKEKEAHHVAFKGFDKDEESGTGTHYGGSIPIEKGISVDVLLAYEMNGEPLASEHGFPLRVVAGGYIGARSVKWLSEITLQETPSDNYYQAHEYKLFPPHVSAATADFAEGEMLGEVPLNAIICSPAEDEALATGSVLVQGYAIAGGNHRVKRVEVSQDGGKTWVAANLLDNEDYSAAWWFWETNLNLDPGSQQIVVRATDSTSYSQPKDIGEVWNFQGYANNAWHRVNISVVC